MKKIIGSFLFTVSCFTFSACDSSPSKVQDMGAAVDSGTSLCGKPGDKAVNDTGVGKFCEGGSEANSCTGNGMATTCSAAGNLAQGAPITYFCTFFCTDSDIGKQGPCGANATCYKFGTFPAACVPNSCLAAFQADGGVH